MLRFFKSLFGKPTEPKTEAPYKVEAPVAEPVVAVPVLEPVKCGCGRSATGFCVGLHKLTPDQWDAHPDNPAKTVAETKAPAAEKPAAKKAPAKKKAAAEKPAAKPAAITATKKRPSKKTPV